MQKLITMFMALLLITVNAHAESALQFKPNSTYVHIYDVDLASEKFYGTEDKKNIGDGIAFYTTSSFDSHEGVGTLHIGTKGVFFKHGDELVCGWKEKQLVDCPSDLPLIVEQQKNGKLSIFVYAEHLEKKEPVFHFRGKELFLQRGSLEKDQAARWEIVRTNAKGEIGSNKTVKPQ